MKTEARPRGGRGCFKGSLRRPCDGVCLGRPPEGAGRPPPAGGAWLWEATRRRPWRWALGIVPAVEDKAFCLFFVFTISGIGFKYILGFSFWAGWSERALTASATEGLQRAAVWGEGKRTGAGGLGKGRIHSTAGRAMSLHPASQITRPRPLTPKPDVSAGRPQKLLRRTPAFRAEHPRSGEAPACLLSVLPP